MGANAWFSVVLVVDLNCSGLVLVGFSLFWVLKCGSRQFLWRFQVVLGDFRLVLGAYMRV